jgi:uncharacterized SAM-binding protein YcdF (DUF218 family)
MDVDVLAKILWDYNYIDHPLDKTDAILVLGSHDTRVAEHGAKLFLEGWAPLLIFSGGRGRLTGDWTKPEADMFADIAEKAGVPREKMLIENRSTNTGENIDFTKRLLEEKGISVSKLILVQKPYMMRRAYATFRKYWPEKEILLSPPAVSYEDYPNEEISKEEMINIIVGDTQRIKIYPDKGFQIAQEIPDAVWDAYEQLVERGYTKYVVAS